MCVLEGVSTWAEPEWNLAGRFLQLHPGGGSWGYEDVVMKPAGIPAERLVCSALLTGFLQLMAPMLSSAPSCFHVCCWERHGLCPMQNRNDASLINQKQSVKEELHRSNTQLKAPHCSNRDLQRLCLQCSMPSIYQNKQKITLPKKIYFTFYIVCTTWKHHVHKICSLGIKRDISGLWDSKTSPLGPCLWYFIQQWAGWHLMTESQNF